MNYEHSIQGMSETVGSADSQLTKYMKALTLPEILKDCAITWFWHLKSAFVCAKETLHLALIGIRADDIAIRLYSLSSKWLRMLITPIVNVAHHMIDKADRYPKTSFALSCLFIAVLTLSVKMFKDRRRIYRPYIVKTRQYQPGWPAVLQLDRKENIDKISAWQTRHDDLLEDEQATNLITNSNMPKNGEQSKALVSNIKTHCSLLRHLRQGPQLKTPLFRSGATFHLFKVKVKHLDLSIFDTMLSFLDPEKIVTILGTVKEVRHYSTETRLLADEYETLANNSFVTLELTVLDHDKTWFGTLFSTEMSPKQVFNIPAELTVPMRALESVVNRRTVTTNLAGIQNQLISYFSSESKLSFGLEERLLNNCEPVFQNLMYLAININKDIDDYVNYDGKLVFRITQ
jgi:hypothetical protein